MNYGYTATLRTGQDGCLHRRHTDLNPCVSSGLLLAWFRWVGHLPQLRIDGSSEIRVGEPSRGQDHP